jgi:hypothetical protein
MTSKMTSDRDFENQLFALYGDEAAEWADDGVTGRVLREIDRETRVRRTVLAAAATIGVVLSAALLAAFAGPMIARAADIAGAPPLALWAAMLAGAASLGWATARLALDA